MQDIVQPCSKNILFKILLWTLVSIYAIAGYGIH